MNQFKALFTFMMGIELTGGGEGEGEGEGGGGGEENSDPYIRLSLRPTLN